MNKKYLKKTYKKAIDRTIVLSVAILFIFFSFVGNASAKSAFILSVAHEIPEEVHWQEILASNLYWLFRYNGYTAYNYHNDTHLFTVYYAAGAYQENYFAITFYIGHGGYYIDDHWIYHYYISTLDSYAYDYRIYDHTYAKKNHLIFMWSCHQGKEVGGIIYGEVHGQPYAWTRTYLGYYGYWIPDGSTYVFIGFKEEAPLITRTIEGVDKAGYQFIWYFFAFATAWYEDNSIRYSLDLAAKYVWRKNITWDQSPLFTDFHMWVYGDSSLVLNDLPGGDTL